MILTIAFSKQTRPNSIENSAKNNPEILLGYVPGQNRSHVKNGGCMHAG